MVKVKVGMMLRLKIVALALLQHDLLLISPKQHLTNLLYHSLTNVLQKSRHQLVKNQFAVFYS
ncbi:MAG: hypothetical protein TV41_05830 [Wolbachia endosymbiont of Dactylopius coccus]|nr:MAG: hypothetical protein TV41_05830 [Wolbachia endosymbiont of Dactylopius coccus]